MKNVSKTKSIRSAIRDLHQTALRRILTIIQGQKEESEN